MSISVLVTDGEQRAALAVVRSLGDAGYDVHVASSRRRSLAGASRHARVQIQFPDSLQDPTAFADAVVRYCDAHRINFLVPIAEPAMLALLPIRASLAPACIPFGDIDAFRLVSDKAGLMALAPDFEIPVPAQHVVADHSAVPSLQRENIRFPVVLKPARSVGEVDGRRMKLGVRHAANWQQLLAQLIDLPAAAFPVLLQQRIVGPGVGIFLLRWDGRVLAQFAHRRLREKPPAGGVSVYRESVAADPDLVVRSRALLDRCGWRQGVAMIEYKVDEATGVPYLMEINGRFWGSLQLAVDAGVDFPRLLLEAATGRQPAPVTTYRIGVRSRWWWGDVDHLLMRLRRTDAELSLPPDAPGRWRVVRDFLTLWRPGDRNEIFRMNDPAPLFRETIEWLRGR